MRFALLSSLFLALVVQSASAQEATTTLNLTTHEMLFFGALVDKETCTVREIADGTCEALQLHNKIQGQIGQQMNDAQRKAQAANQSALDKLIEDKAAAKLKTDAEAAEKAKTAAPKTDPDTREGHNP